MTATSAGGSRSTGFFPATARLVGARWRIAWNTLRRGARWRRLTYAVVLAALAFLSFVSLGTSYVFTIVIVGVAEDPTAADVIVSSALSGSLMLCFMVSFTVALGALYLSADLDLLLSSPVSRRAVFASKLVGGLLPGQALILAIGLVPLIGHGIASGYGASFYSAVLLALFLLPIIPSAVGATAVVLIVRRVSAHRLGEIIGLIVVAMTLTIALVASNSGELQAAVTVSDLLDILNRFRNPYSPAEWLTRAVVAAGRAESATAVRWFAISGGAALVCLLPLILISDGLYYEGWVRMHSENVRRRLGGGWLPWLRSDSAARLSRPSGLLRWLSPPTAAIIRKDFRLIPRDLTNLAQVLSPLAIGVFFVLQQALYPIRIGGDDRPQTLVLPLLAMLSAAISSGVGAMIMSRFGLTAFSFEGRRYWVIKSAPIQRRELILGKFLVGYLPYLALAGVLVPALELARALNEATRGGAFDVSIVVQIMNPLIIGYALFVVAVVGAGVIAISLAIGAARPNMRWDSPHEMMTPDIGCISLVLYGGYLGITLLALTMPAALGGFPMLEHPGWLWMGGLAIGLGTTAIVVASSLWLAMREIDAIGE